MAAEGECDWIYRAPNRERLTFFHPKNPAFQTEKVVDKRVIHSRVLHTPLHLDEALIGSRV